MKHLKIIGLAVIAAAAFMAFAGSASAAGTFTSPSGTAYTGSLSASLEGSALLKAGFANITCTSSTVEGEVKTNNATEASGPINTVLFSSCGSATVTTLNHKGTLHITAGTHAVEGTGTEVTVSLFGTDCIYGLGSGTPLGTAANSGTTVTLAIKANLTLVSGGFGCSSPAAWTANYVVTTPATSSVD